MKFNLLLKKSCKMLGLAALVTFFIASGDLFCKSYTAPDYPLLSLTGKDIKYNSDWYKDGRLVVPPAVSKDKPREILVPVFIENHWVKSSEWGASYASMREIQSFSFKIQYDERALRAIDVVTAHPVPYSLGENGDITDSRYLGGDGQFYEPLASGFQFSVADYKDTTYRRYLGDNNLDADNLHGRSFKITAVGPRLPQSSSTLDEEYKVLLYVRFQVIPDYTTQGQTGEGNTTFMYIGPDSIKYNDKFVTENPFPTVQPNWQPNDYPGLAGIRESAGSTLPLKPGAIKVLVTSKVPTFDFYMDKTTNVDPISKSITNKTYSDFGEEFTINDPFTVDSLLATNANTAVKLLEMTTLSGTRLQDISIESDQPWLLFRSDPSRSTRTISDWTRSGSIPRLDAIVPEDGFLDATNTMVYPDSPVWLDVLCNPGALIANQEATGIYNGTLTFKSAFSYVDPVKVKVTFIFLRPPYEPDLYKTDGNHRGIALRLTANADTTNMVFGVGPRATDGIDTLFGEGAYTNPMTAFGARWFPLSTKDANLQANGYRDNFPSYAMPQYASRDIRSISDTMRSLTYWCKFLTNNYPVVISWDPADIPADAQVYLKYQDANGDYQYKSLREGNPEDGGRLSYTLTNKNLKEFFIEYTLPKVIKFVDDYGNPIIQKGWNLLSLPVRPSNATWNVVYPHAQNKPYAYFVDGWQAQDEVLKPGVGYFVKYSDDIDQQFAGSYIGVISQATGDPIALFPGWNAIGALSDPINVSSIKFDQYEQDPVAQLDYALENGIYGYTTNEGYKEVTELRPGMGYFVKVGRTDESNDKAHAYLNLSVPAKAKLATDSYVNSSKELTTAQSAKLNVRDNAQHSATLLLSNDNNVKVANFELPPTPAYNMFDVRFANNARLDNSNKAVVKLQGITYPVALQMTNSNSNYKFVDAISGKVLGSIVKGSTQSIEINSTVGDAIAVETESVSDYSINVYPNPAETVSQVSYSVPEKQFVSIKLFDIFGNEVSTLVNQVVDGGQNYASLNVANLASGSYICKFTAGNYTTSFTINVVK